MKQTRKYQFVFAIFMIFSMMQSNFALAQTPAAPAVGNLTIAIQDDYGNVVGGGCFGVTDANGQYSSFCDDDGDGYIELGNVPAGDAFIMQESAPAGYTGATSQSMYVLPDQTVVAYFYIAAVPVETPVPTVEVTEVPTEEPTQVATEAPSDIATEAPTDVATEVPTDEATEAATKIPTDEGTETVAEESTPASSNVSRESQRLISPMAFGDPGVQCTPVTGNGGRMILNAYIPGEATDTAPTISYTVTDRFGNVSEPIDAVMTWNPSSGRWVFPLDVVADEVDFIINTGEEELGVSAGCSVFNPIGPIIDTMAVDGSGANLPDGTQIDTGRPFGDTAKFVNLQPEALESLVGQTVTYNLYEDDATCESTPVQSYSVTIGDNGIIPPTPLFTPSGNHIYDWQVTFNGFAPNFSEASSECGAETVIVGEVTTSVATTIKDGDGNTIPQGATVPIGTSVYDTTVLNGANADAGGEVIYELVMGTCGDATTVWGPTTVDVSNGAVPDSGPAFTPTEQGVYHWIVTYSGDANNAGDVSGCGEETFTVAPAAPTITTAMFQADGTPINQGGSVSIGTSVYDTTTIEGAYGIPTGEVIYTLYSGACPGTVVGESVSLPLNEDGTFPQSPAIPANAPGLYNWVVAYSGDANNAPATSGCGSETFVVDPAPTGVATGPQVSDGQDGFTDLDNNAFIPAPADVRDTAEITDVPDDGPIPTGTVTYTLYASSGCSGTVVYEIDVDLNDDGTVPETPVVPGLKPGQYNWQAVYSGDNNYKGSTSPCGAEQFFVTDGVDGSFITTQLKSADGGNIADGGTVNLGSSAYDTTTFFGGIVDTNGNIAIAGTLTYYVYATGSEGANCSTPLDSWPFEVGVGNSIPQMSATDTYRFANAGTYDFQAVFTYGDGQTTSSICGTETVVVNPVTPTITTAMTADDAPLAHQGRVTLPTSVGDSVTVTYPQDVDLTGIPAPQGALQYQLFNGTDCSTEPVFTSTKAVADGTWPASDSHPLTEVTHAGNYNWVVTYIPAEGETNYASGVSGCYSETFSLDVEPTLTTEMYESADGSGDGTVLPNGEEVVVGDFVRDTGTLTNFGPNAGGNVVFTLYQGGTCDGTALFSNTIQVVDGQLQSGTDWFPVKLFGNYSWLATYSGDTTQGGFTTTAVSDCSTETFVATQGTPDPTIETVMRNGDAVIPHLNYIARPASVNDQAIFTNLSDSAEGTITYELFDTAACESDAVYTNEQTVSNGLAPRSGSYEIGEIGNPVGKIYSWVATFVGTDQDEVVNLTSPCGEEQFRIYDAIEYFAVTDCSYNANSNTSTYTIELRPQPLPGSTAESLHVEMQPFNLDLSPADPFEVDDQWTITYTTDAWRRLTGTATWGNGSHASFRLACNTNPWTPELSTTMFSRTDEGVVEIENDTTLPIGSVLFDTTQIAPETSTIVMDGTLTYQLYSDAECSVPVGGPIVHTLDATSWDSMPDSNDVTLTDAGSYYWVVTYAPDPDERFPDNAQAISDCGEEWFHIEQNETSITTAQHYSDEEGALGDPLADGSTIAIDSWVTDTATITGLTDSAGGTATYTLYQGGTCADGTLTGGTQVYTSGALPIANGAIPQAGSANIANIGSYTWIVEYSGDNNNAAFTTPCGVEVFQVNQTTSTITTVMEYAEGGVIAPGGIVPIDSIVIDTATIDGQSNNATGTVTYTLVRGESCDPGVAEVITSFEVELADGLIPDFTPGITIDTVGTYNWIVEYSGDANNAASISPCGDETFVVDQTESTITTVMEYADGGVIAHDGVVPIDSLVIDTASIEGLSENATGTVKYTLIRGEDCRAEVPEVIATATVDLSEGLVPDFSPGVKIENIGTYHWIVEYSGDANNAASISPCGDETFVVDQTDSSITTVMMFDGEDGAVIEQGDIVPIDSIVIDTATIEGQSDNATGTVTYMLIRGEGCDEETSEVITSFEVNLADGLIPDFAPGIKIENIGVYNWVVEYSGDGNNASSISPCGAETFEVAKTTPTITTTMKQTDEAATVIEQGSVVPIDSFVIDTAVIDGQSDNATGTVSYTLIRSESCDDEGQVTIAEFTVDLESGLIPDFAPGIKIENIGTYNWIVEYSGDANNEASTSPCGAETFVVDQATPVVTTMMKHADEAGTVIEQGGIVPIDSLVIDTAVIDGQSDNATGTVTYTLVRGENCEVEEPEVITSFTVDMVDGLIPDFAPGVKIENVGTYNWIVEYSGDDNNAASISPCGAETFVVAAAEPVLETVMLFGGEEATVIENGTVVAIDTSVLDTATITGQSDNAAGTVTYQLFRGEVCGAEEAELITEATVDLTEGSIPNFDPAVTIENVGVYFWVVSYSGDANNAEAISDGCDEWFQVDPTESIVTTVMELPDGTVVENDTILPRGSEVLDTATISGLSNNATGTVSYQLYGDALCETPFGVPYSVELADGEVSDSLPITVVDAGSYYWIVSYSGDANNAASESGCGEEFFHIEQVGPSVLTTMKYEDGTVIENDEVVHTGSVVLDTAVLVGATDDASGTATYQLFSDASCTVPVTEPQEVAVENGVIENSASFTVSEPGTYFWVVSYSGDANNAAAVSGCGEEFFQAELPPVDPTPEPTIPATPDPSTPVPSTPVAPGTPDPSGPVTGLPSTGTGSTSAWLMTSLIGLFAAGFVAFALRSRASTR